MQLEKGNVNVEIKLSSGAVEKIREVTGLEVKSFRLEAVDDKRLDLQPSRLENLKII